tara:strand:- start:923 stop:1042 length:120 start_codon:yes stop_codon:yes gene_type:complete
MFTKIWNYIKDLFDDRDLELYDQAIMELKMDEKMGRGNE